MRMGSPFRSSLTSSNRIVLQAAIGTPFWGWTLPLAVGTASLQILSSGNINAVGTYQIDAGTVQLTAPSGGSFDELDGAGLVFGNAANTALTFVDSTPGTPGTVT